MPPPDAPARLPLLAIGGSAGSLGPLTELLAGLPADLPAAVLVCQHTSERGRSQLPQILARHGPLPAAWATEGDRLRAGRIHVAPPGHHLFVQADRARLSTGPRVNHHRPSVDVLFASVAEAAGPAVTAVVLSGVLDDGAVGAALVDRAGGQVLVQDPEAADFPGMPSAAYAACPHARVVRSRPGSIDVVAAVRRAATLRNGSRTAGAGQEVGMSATEEGDRDFLQPGEDRVVRLACPDCSGGLAQVDLPQISYYRCHIGHQYGPQSLVAALAEASETRLWSAVAALEEEIMLADHLQRRASAAAPSSGRRQDLAARAAELRDQVQRWTGQDPGGSGGQSPAVDPS